MNVTAAPRRAARWLTSPVPIERHRALAAGERLIAVTHVMASAEHLKNRHERRAGGVNDWGLIRAGQPFKSVALRRVIDVASRPLVTDALHVVRIGAAIVLLGARRRRIRLGADVALAAIAHALGPRHHYGADGADQVAALTPVVASIARLRSTRDHWVDACLWALALQGGMSYGFSGFVKLAGERWRQHDAVIGVMRTRTYGDRRAWQVMCRFPWLSRVVGVATLSLECLFCTVFVARGRLTRPVLMVTSGMHAGIAATMGLGRFVPSFLSMYPAIAYVTRPRASTATQQGGARADLLPRLSVGLAAVSAVALAVDATRRDRRVTAPPPGSRALRTPSGACLRARTVRNDDPAAPLVVFENGLLSMPELWQWVREDVATRASTLVYDRGGYGPSSPGPLRTFDAVVDDLAAVIAAAADDRPVIVVGHSLGGYIAHRLAQAHPDTVSGLVLVDSSHPDVLESSVRQQLGCEAMVSTLRLSSWSMAAGMGRFLAEPALMALLPEEVRPSVLDRYRNRRMWTAGAEEWTAALRDFERRPSLERLGDLPLVVLTAGETAAQEETVLELHRDLARTSTEGRHELIDGASHETIIMSSSHARVVAKHIVGLIDRIEVSR